MVNKDDVKLCNCVNCNRTSLGISMRGVKKDDLPPEFRAMPRIGGKIKGSPWCEDCLEIPSCGICGSCSKREDPDIKDYRVFAPKSVK